jgi:phytoene synthase
MRKNYASDADIELCRQIHQRYGTTYYYSTLRFPKRIQRRVHSIYAFVRVPDEWVDNPGDTTKEDRKALLEDWRSQMVRGLNGECPQHFALRAFCDTVLECRIPVEEAHLFLDAMEMDITKSTYDSYEDLRAYMMGSACAIGVMMCYAMCARTDYDTIARARALGEAMQLTNFLRDISEDLERGRIYLPASDLRRFGVTYEDLKSKKLTPQIRMLLQFEIERARSLYSMSDFGIYKLPPKMRKAVLLSRLLYSQILNKIEAQGYDVFRARARTNIFDKLLCMVKVISRDRQILVKLVNASGLKI